MSAINEIRKAYEEATGSWTGCDWTIEHCVSSDYNDDPPRASFINLDDYSSEELRELANSADSESLPEPGDSDWLRWHDYADAEALRAAADELDSITESAEKAEEYAARAMDLLSQGKFAEASEAGREAESIEREYGDSPVWGTFSDLLDELEIVT